MEKTKQNVFLCKTVRAKVAAAALAVLASVALPQIFHLLGMLSDMGSSLGETFLPMHLTIFLVGYFAGGAAGAAAGALSPLLSFALTSAAGEAMPALAMLPFMMIELCVYGLTTGLFTRFGKGRVPVIVSLLAAQIAGRAIRALAILIGVYAFGSPLPVSVIWTSLLAGLPGLSLQWILIPLILFWAEKKLRRD